MKPLRTFFLLTAINISLFAQSVPNKTAPLTTSKDVDAASVPEAEEKLDKERWRFLFYTGVGRGDIQTNPNIPFAYRDPNTGQTVNPGIGKRTGLTNAGTTNFPSEGSGNNQGAVFSLVNHKWLFAYGYTTLDLKMSPANSSSLPVRTFESSSDHTIRNIRVDYSEKLSDLFTAVFSVRQFSRVGNYQWDNVIETTNATNYYIAFPKFQVNDNMRINMFTVGLKLNYFSNFEIEPYFQYRDARFFANVIPTVGVVQKFDNLYLPADGSALIGSWAYQGLGSAYALPLSSVINKEFGNVGLRLQYSPFKFLIFRSDVRRNYVLAAWEARGSVTMFFNKHFGLTLGGVYAEAEINPLALRGWEIGPIFTYLF